MSMATQVPQASHSHSCNDSHQPVVSSALGRLMMKAAAVALGAFAAYLSWKLFLPASIIGAAVGFVHREGQNQVKPLQATCSQSTLEQLTGISLPGFISLIFGVFAMVEHMDHHPRVYVPIAGFTLGFGAGNYVRGFISP